MIKLAIVGSVDLNEVQVRDAAYLIECILISRGPRLVISGGAAGIDSLAINAAQRWGGTQTEEIRPDVASWNPPGRRGFRARNIEIAERCDELIAIRSLQSKTYGSGWTADYAEKLGKKVRRYYV